MSAPIRVLYVDDYRLDRELVRDALEREDGAFQVAEAASRSDFEALLAAGPWDLVLTDYCIGDFQGLEVIEKVRDQHPGVPVVMLTGTGSEEVAVEALKRGAADYVLKKSQHIQRLPFTLRSVLERARAEETEYRLTRQLRALTKCSEALLRAKDEESLYDEICQIVCEVGGYRVAWVGLVDPEEPNALRVAAVAGDETAPVVPRILDSSEDADSQETTVWEAVAAGEGHQSLLALPLKRPDGGVFGVLAIYSAKRDAATPDETRLLEQLASDLAYGVAALRSYAERNQAEEALRRSEERLRLAVEASGQALWELHVPTASILASLEMAELLEFKPGEYVSSLERWALRLHEDDRPRAEARMRACLAGEESVYEDEYRILSASGAWRWLYARGRVVERDPEGRPVRMLGTVADITSRKLAEEALREAEEQLRQSQKMEAVGRLAGGIAHDFNNIITTILGFSDIILAGEPCDAGALRSDIEEIRAAADRASTLTRQILAFSRRQALARQVVSLNDIVARTERLVCRTLGEDIEVVVLSAPDLGLTEVDPGQLEQVLVNMAVNSRDAMPDGGRLTFETANVELDGDYCRTHLDAVPGSYVMVAVSDNGIGMSAETTSRVFEPFFTTKAPGKGTGLGLATAYGIVRQCGGSISVRSEVGEGSVFRIYLPRLARSAEPETAAGSQPRSLGGHETLLVLEDERSVRELVRRTLTKLGYTVLTAATGKEALALLEEDASIDLLLADMVLPGGIRGDAVADAASSLHPGLPIVFMSGYVQEWAVGGGRLQPGVNCLVKPFRPEDLARLVRETLDASPRPPR